MQGLNFAESDLLHTSTSSEWDDLLKGLFSGLAFNLVVLCLLPFSGLVIFYNIIGLAVVSWLGKSFSTYKIIGWVAGGTVWIVGTLILTK